ncbi:expressed unknown protein [Seminavis robusta]|uniref:Uncharacterized protein n=1 Tax=Seminavis robusta TaxID=568900 RepID=A0A9N8HAZ2_9STRA|nr:expressed unknown protein [Seminavis robusta]|eukprot:Sro259_g101330.1 n/a (316) ;mRNA; r:35035-36292
MTKFLYFGFTVLAVLVSVTDARLGADEDRELQQDVIQGQHVITNTYPLSLCQGDCDSDSDCGDNLKCFHRHAGDPLPLCNIAEGEVTHRTDYCVPIGAPESLLGPPLTVVGNNGDGPFPLGKCQGDCDTNAECQEGLICFQRNAGQPVPGCRGSHNARTDFCIDPADQAALEASNFPVSATRDMAVFLNYTITQNDRQPTNAEYQALGVETDKWLTDEVDRIFANNNNQLHDIAITIGKAEYLPSQEATQQIRWNAKMTWTATSANYIPTAFEISQRRNNFQVFSYQTVYLQALDSSNVFFNTGSVGFGLSPAEF